MLARVLKACRTWFSPTFSFSPGRLLLRACSRPNRPRLAARQARRVRLEPLEDRRLLSVEPFPVPLVAQLPLGSLVYSGFAAGEIAAPDQTDQFTMDLDDGQTITVVVDPGAALQPALEVRDPAGVSLGSTAAGSAGAEAVLQVLPVVTAGTYTIDVSGAGGSIGTHDVALVLNAAVEMESHGGPANDDAASAEDLGPAFVAIGDAWADRAAVLAQADSAGDWYRFRLSDGQSASLALKGPGTELELYSDAAVRITSGLPGSTNVDQAIGQFVDVTADGQPTTYYARVTSPSPADYTLLITRGAVFNLEPDDTLAAAECMPPDTVALGHLDARTSTTWGERRQFFGSGIDHYSYFGGDVAISGDLAIVGAGQDDTTQHSAGSAFVYRYDGLDWTLQQQLTPSDPEIGAYFGGAVALDGDWAIIGSSRDDEGGASDAGSAYVFHREGDSWVQSQKLTAPVPLYDARFGAEVAIRGELAVVGSPQADVGAYFDAGAVYVFRYNGVAWVEEQSLTSSGIDSGDAFGSAIAIGDEQILVGAYKDEPSATSAGVVYAFRFDGTQWTQPQRFYPSGWQGYECFGTSIAIEGDVALIGADRKNSDRGAAYVFRFNGDSWIQEQKLTASDGASGDHFGISVSLSGNFALVGAYYTRAGAAYLFVYSAGSWIQQQKLTASNGQPNDLFGCSVASWGETALIGARYDSVGSASQAGSVYAFQPLRLDAEDCWAFRVQAGDLLELSTQTPLDSPGEPSNGLDPQIALYDPAGTLVASDDNSAADGRNARIAHTAEQSGVYTVRVFSPVKPGGEYVLKVIGATGIPPAFQVAAVSPAEGALLSAPPTQITLDFNAPVRQDTLAADRLTVDGHAAAAYAVVDPDTVRFVLAESLGDGVHAFSIASGDVLDLQGRPLDAYSGTFRVDTTPPRIIESSIQRDDVIAPGRLQAVFRFDEPLDSATVTSTGFDLYGQSHGYTSCESFWYDPVSSTLVVQYEDVPEDAYTLIVRSGDGCFEDLAGWTLDGEATAWPIPPNLSGDGLPGGSFRVPFVVDTTSVDLAPMLALDPLGSFAYYANDSLPAIHRSDDVDTFTLQLEAGQTLRVTIAVSQWVTQLSANVELRDPNSEVVASATVPPSDHPIFLQSPTPTMAGTYSLRVSSADGSTGVYWVTVYLNCASEDEWYSGSTNDTAATAQDLDPVFTELGLGAGTRAALLGETDDAARTDWYRFTLADGESASLAVKGTGTQLDLYDAAAVHITSGLPGLTNVDRAIQQFVDVTADAQPTAYYVRIAASRTQAYTLVITRGAVFNLEADNTLVTAAVLSPAAAAVGHIDMRPSSTWAEGQQLFGSGIDKSDYFGTTVEMAGDVAIVGAPYDDTTLFGAGSAFVYHYDGTNWTLQQQLVASDPKYDAHFGSAAIDGDWAIVGAFDDDESGLGDVGSVYMFHFDGTSWVQTQKLTASDPAAYDHFGSRVAIRDDLAVVGASGADVAGYDSGAAYVFRYNGECWVQEQKLIGSAVDSLDGFGLDVALDGQQILIGAYRDEVTADSSGVVYVFRHDGNQWTERQRFYPTDWQSGEYFGVSIAMEGDVAVIGDYGNHSGRGAAYVFRYKGDSWVQEQQLTASDATSGDNFGRSVSLSGDLVLVGAERKDVSSQDSAGAAYVFAYKGATWLQEQKLTASNGQGNGFFGCAVALSGDKALIGADHNDAGSYTDAGSVYAFHALPTDSEDYWAIRVRAGDALAIATLTPLDSPGEPSNTLDPQIELYDPAGTVVASDDNGAPDGRNAQVSYTTLQSGIYTVRVFSVVKPGGEYVLQVAGPTGALPDLQVAATTPASGALLGALPAEISVDFNQPIRQDTVAASDLTIDGIAAPGVTLEDTDTLRFSLPGALAEGTHSIEMVAASLLGLYGQPLVGGYSGTFRYDATGPGVTIDQASDQTDPVLAQPIRFAVVFSEPVSDFAAADVSIEGTAPGARVESLSGGGMSYEVVVSGMTGAGTVSARVAAAVAHDEAGNANIPSTSVDNVVTYYVNQPPVADAGGPYTANLGDAVTLSAAGSYDPDESLGDRIVLYAWDVDGDGQFGEAHDLAGPEPEISPGVVSWLGPGSHTLRLRVEDTSGLTTTATAQLTIHGWDFGDAPDPGYPTLLASDGARHEVVPGFCLGNLIDGELDGQPTAGANGDDLAGVDDEDGVMLFGRLVQGMLVQWTVTASAAGLLDAWVDWDQDGAWEAEEQIAASTPLAAGANVIAAQVPVTAAAGETFARFRLSSAGGLGPDGPAADGEVEDYRLVVEAAADQGAVDFLVLPGQDPAAAVRWYRCTTVRAGTLTLDATYDAGAGSAAVTLYDAAGQRLADSHDGTGYERIDHPCGAGETYFARLTGDNAGVDLRLANLVQQSGNVVAVAGTGGDDTFTLELGTDYAVTINSVAYHFDPAGVATIAFDGLMGGGSAVLGGSLGVDAIEMEPGSASLNTGSLVATVVNCPSITIRGGGEADTVVMNDSGEDDTFTASPQTATLSGPGFTNTVEQMPNIYVYARNGGHDVAYLEGGSGKDKIKFQANVAWMYGGNYYVRPKFFDEVYADAKAGTTDTAIFYDTPGADVLAADPNVTTVTTGSLLRKATGFENVTVYGTKIDTATFNDSPGDDIFNGLNHKSYMYGSGYKIVSRGFKKVTATASTGFDKARLYDTIYDDRYECWPGISKVTGGGTSVLAITAQGFDKVSLVPTLGGFDTADLYDTEGDDRLDASGSLARLYRNAAVLELLYEALSVNQVTVHGSTGTNARNVTEPLVFDLIFDGNWEP